MSLYGTLGNIAGQVAGAGLGVPYGQQIGGVLGGQLGGQGYINPHQAGNVLLQQNADEITDWGMEQFFQVGGMVNDPLMMDDGGRVTLGRLGGNPSNYSFGPGQMFGANHADRAAWAEDVAGTKAADALVADDSGEVGYYETQRVPQGGTMMTRGDALGAHYDPTGPVGQYGSDAIADNQIGNPMYKDEHGFSKNYLPVDEQTVAGGIGSAIGSALIPIPFIGGMIGKKIAQSAVPDVGIDNEIIDVAKQMNSAAAIDKTNPAYVPASKQSAAPGPAGIQTKASKAANIVKLMDTQTPAKVAAAKASPAYVAPKAQPKAPPRPGGPPTRSSSSSSSGGGGGSSNVVTTRSGGAVTDRHGNAVTFGGGSSSSSDSGGGGGGGGK